MSRFYRGFASDLAWYPSDSRPHRNPVMNAMKIAVTKKAMII
jgi:hypothetical protein